MSIEVTVLLSVAGVCLTLITVTRSAKKDNKDSGKQEGQVMEKLDNLTSKIDNLDKKFDNQSAEISSIKEKYAELKARLDIISPIVKELASKVFGKNYME